MDLTIGTNFSELVDMIIGVINTIIPVLVGFAFILFLWGGVRYIFLAGGAKSKTQTKYMLVWGLVAMFVLVSIMGILQFLNELFLL